MHQLYGVDLGDRELLRSRSWRWFKVRLVGLVSTECRLSLALNKNR